MKWSAAFKISKKTLTGGLVWCIILSAVAVYWLLVSWETAMDLSRQKKDSLTVSGTGEIHQAVLSEAQKIDGVSVISEKRMTGGTLVFGEYSQMVTVYGVSPAYMREVSGGIAADFEGAMPYVLMDAAALKGFKNEDDEPLVVEDEGALYMQTMTLAGEYEVPLRMAGTTENEAFLGDALPDDASNQGGCIYMALDWFEKLWPDADMTEEVKTVTVRIKDGSFIEPVSEALSRLGIAVTEGYTTLWTDMEKTAEDALYKGMLALASASLAGYYELKLWRLRHKALLSYMHWLLGGSHLTKVWLCRYGIAAAAAVAAGLIYWGGVTIFGVPPTGI